MGNKKVLSKATRELNKTKRFATPKNIIEDPRGQWDHPGEITRIPSDTITMQGVPYPVMAYPNMGEPQMMYPGQEYYFPGADYVDEYPQMKKGGTPKSLVKMPKPSKKGLASKKFSRSLEATNRLFTEHPLFAKPKSKKRKVFDPNAVYQDGGIMDQEEPTGGITSQEEIDAANRAMMRARLAYAQMHGNPAAQRMVVAPDQPYEYTGDEYDQLWGQPVGAQPGMIGTHYMASFDNYAVPFIQQGPNGLYFNEAPSVRDREAIRFDSEEDAEYFGGHYKEVAPDKSYRKKIENGSPYITSLSPEDEEQFQRFYNTLPENLQSDDPSYDIRGYWDSEGRPEEFDYSQPKEDDGYYHAYSINQNTGEYLKNPWHPTFQHAIDEDKKIGYRPVVNVKGELIATENPSIADPEEQTFLRNTEGPANYIETELTPEEIEEYRKGGFIVEDISVPSLNQMKDGGSDPKTTFYTVEGSGGVYRKVNGKWEVDWNRSGNFQPITKGDVKARTAVLEKKAKPLYDATYDDLYTTKQSAYTAQPKPKPTSTKKPTAQSKAAQEQFDKNFQVTGKSKMEVVEDKIQKSIDDYAKYHQEQTGKPLTQEEYDDAYQIGYNIAYADAGTYKPSMSGPVANPYGTTEPRKNLISLDPGKAPKNLTLGDYVNKGWDIVSNPLDYASYALRPKGTVTTPWNMTNYENRLEAAGLEDPITANNNVSKAIDFATYFTPIGAAAQGLKMIPGTAYSIGKAFEEPSWENTGDALFNTGIAALSLAPGFGAAKNLGRGVSSIDDLKAIEALRGNTATTPFQSYYLTGNRALNASEAALPQAQALRRFTGQQSLELPAGQPEFFNSEYKKLYDELQESISKQKAVSDELANFDPMAKINQSKVDNKAFNELIMGDDLKFKFDDYPDTPRIPVRYAGLEQIRSKRGPISLNLAADTPGQLPPLTRTPREMKAIDDLRKLHSGTKTGQSNAEEVFNRFKSQKLKDLDTPEGRRRIQEYIDDNNITKTDYAQTNYDEISKRYDLRDVLTNPNHEKHQIAVEGLKEELIKKGRNPSDYNLNSWDEFTGDVILSNMRLYLNADDIVAKSYPDYTPGFIERPITPDEYIDYVKTLKYSNPETNIKIQEDRIDNYRKRLSKLRAKKDELLKDYQEGNIPFDTYRRIKSAQEADIIRTEQEIMSVQMSIDWLINDLVKSNAAYNLGPNTVQIGDPLTSIGDLDRALYHEVGHATELPLLKSTDTSKVDKDLLDEVVLAEKAPAHLLQDLDLDAMSQVPPYRLSRFSLSKAQNPIAYWNQARSYFRGPEASAFVAELRPLLKEAGLIKNDFDKVTPEMVEELYQDYISRPVWETGTRIFDIIEPVDKSFKAISKALNKIKGVAPYAVPVGLGVGATGLAGQEEMQQDMEYQDGGIIMELSDDEIQEYANGGFVVEELDYKPDAGKVLNKKTVTNPKPSINTTGLAYKPNVSAKVESPNPKASVQTVPKPKVPKSPPIPPPATIESMGSILDKYDVNNTSPIMTTDVFQSIIDQRNQEKQAKLQKLQRQLDASQRATHTVPEQPVIKQYEFDEEFIEGMPNVRTEQSASYLGGRPLKNEVKKIVLHHTGSTDEKNNNKYVHNHFMNPESETSAHIVIEEDGTRTIYASPDQVTFHAGKSSWDGRDNVNDFGVGVEFQGDTNVKPLTSAQIRSFVEYFDQLAKQYNVSTKDIITHAMIAPGRKPDITESEYRRILKYLTERGYK